MLLSTINLKKYFANQVDNLNSACFNSFIDQRNNFTNKKMTKTGMRKDIAGQRFGRLVAVSRHPIPFKGRSYGWVMRCDCGMEKIIQLRRLSAGDTKSCGCLAKEQAAINGAKRAGLGRDSSGKTTRTYRSWMAMRDRCLNPKNDDYKNYGGRGIKICVRWSKYENFYADMGDRPEGKTLDRIKNNEDYEPRNCRWATKKEQARNRRSNSFYECFGVSRALWDWSEMTNIRVTTILSRMKDGWPFEKAISTPIKQRSRT